MESKGIPELLKVVGKKLNRENAIKANSENNILITPGIKQALFYINCCLINPGDEGIILEPYWITYLDSLKLCGGVPVFVEGKEENNFKATIGEIKSKVTPKTKYILFSNPCNPSGAVWRREELEDIVKIARKHDIFIISDEIYEYFLYDRLKHVSTASLRGAEKLTITFNGFSKGQAMSGWRVGYIVANDKIIKAATKMQQTIATCVCSISQKAAVKGYHAKKEIKNIVREYQERRNIFVRGLNGIKGISCKYPEGAFYVFANISGLNINGLQASSKILDYASVSSVPGIVYGEHYSNYVRFSFAAGRDVLKDAVKRMEKLFLGNR